MSMRRASAMAAAVLSVALLAGCGSAGDEAKKVGDDTSQGISNAGDAAANGAQQAGDKASEGADKAGDTIKDGGAKAGGAVGGN